MNRLSSLLPAFFHHETKRSILLRFIGIVLIFGLYLGYVIWKYGATDGLAVGFLTWSFFVFCTPVADAGLLIDFPIRLIAKVKMIYTEITVWGLAGSVWQGMYFFKPEVFDKTLILQVFWHVITQPWPYWSLFVVCAAGTFMSVYFGDELYELILHRDRVKYQQHRFTFKLVFFVAVLVFTVILYEFLLQSLGLDVPLF